MDMYFCSFCAIFQSVFTRAHVLVFLSNLVIDLFKSIMTPFSLHFETVHIEFHFFSFSLFTVTFYSILEFLFRLYTYVCNSLAFFESLSNTHFLVYTVVCLSSILLIALIELFLSV